MSENTTNEFRENLWECFPELAFADEPVDDSCVMGLALIHDGEPTWVVAYDEVSVINKLSKYFGDFEQADEWFDYNVIGSYLGHSTPVFVDNNLEARRFNREYNYEQVLRMNQVKSLSHFHDKMEKDNNILLLVDLADIGSIKDLI